MQACCPPPAIAAAAAAAAARRRARHRCAALGGLDAPSALHSLSAAAQPAWLLGGGGFLAGAACSATLLLSPLARSLLPPPPPSPLPPFASPVRLEAGPGGPDGSGSADRVLTGPGVALFQHLLTYFYPGLAEVLAAVVRRRLQPALEAVRSATLREVRVEALTLGATPPRVAALKLYDTPSSEVVADVELEWACGGGLRLGVRVGEGGSLVLPVVADGIRFQGVLRIVMAPLLPGPPFLGAMLFSSVGRPNLDFRLSLLGGELSALPGLREALQEAASAALDATFVWPKRILVRPAWPAVALAAAHPSRSCRFGRLGTRRRTCFLFWMRRRRRRCAARLIPR